jgi:hypothetical protein
MYRPRPGQSSAHTSKAGGNGRVTALPGLSSDSDDDNVVVLSSRQLKLRHGSVDTDVDMPDAPSFISRPQVVVYARPDLSESITIPGENTIAYIARERLQSDGTLVWMVKFKDGHKEEVSEFDSRFNI